MKKIVVVDIDGTVTKVGDRQKLMQVKPKHYREFYERCDEDRRNTNVCELVENLYDSDFYKIVFCTGRPEYVREKTEEWIKDNLFLLPSDCDIIMRESNDKRHDTITKPEKLGEYLINNHLDYSSIAFILEDRDSMVKKWRELGLTCLQVAYGDF